MSQSFIYDRPVHLALVLTNSLYNFLTITDSSKTFLHLGNRKLDRFARQDILIYLPWTGQASCNKQRICGRFRYWANHLTKNLIFRNCTSAINLFWTKSSLTKCVLVDFNLIIYLSRWVQVILLTRPVSKDFFKLDLQLVSSKWTKSDRL